MSKLPLLFLLRLTCAATLASPLTGTAMVAMAPAPFADGNPTPGKPLHQRPCVHCQTWRLDGVVDRIYFRRERLVRVQRVLVAQANYCNAELGTKYFPDEEEHIAAYLNKRYYRFE